MQHLRRLLQRRLPEPLHYHHHHLRPFSTARTIADELLNAESSATPKNLHRRLDQLIPSTFLLDHQTFVQTINLSNDAGRSVLSFYDWASKRSPAVTTNEASLIAVIDFLGRRHDFKAIHDLLLERCRSSGSEFTPGMDTFSAVVRRLSRAGRPTHAIKFFHGIDKFGLGGINRKSALFEVVSALVESGHPGHAENLVKKMAEEIFPDDAMCEALVKGWSDAGNLAEARRLAGEISRGGFDLGATAYNAVLDCVCELCRKKDRFRLQSEANSVLLEMESAGVPRDAGTFRILISHLCKIRNTNDALELFTRMGEWSCSPDSETFVLIIKSLYQAARIGEGDELIIAMNKAGFQLTIKDYFGFLRILCGIERIEHAMKVFMRMKEDGCNPATQTYDLLIKKLCNHGKFDEADALRAEAAAKGVSVSDEVYEVNPRFVVQKKKKVKKELKRLTLPMKMKLKKKRLKKLRLSFVKKPSKTRMARAY